MPYLTAKSFLSRTDEAPLNRSVTLNAENESAALILDEKRRTCEHAREKLSESPLS
jgi:hypothetical protein